MTIGIKSTQKEFIDKAILVHGNKFDYSKVEYVNNKTKVCIVCRIHGEFLQEAAAHVNQKQGCKLCANEFIGNKSRTTQDEFLKRAISIHGNKYDYSNVKYVTAKVKIDIKCNLCGINFKQTPDHHFSDLGGCRKCQYKNNSKILRSNNEDFINKSIKVHGDKFDYSMIEYKTAKEKVKIICKKCKQIFLKTPDGHLSGQGCSHCWHSKEQQDLLDFIKSIYDQKIIKGDRNIIKPLELDILLPNIKLAIEYNGLHWHSDKYLNNIYHLDKTNKCLEKGYDLLHIYSDEWIYKQDIVQSIIKEKLNLLDYNINSNDLEFNILNKNQTFEFFNENHIEGFIESDLYFGLVDKNNEIYYCISIKQNNDILEIIQFCNKINYKVIDGFKKLINNIELFANEYYYINIIGLSDKRFNQENIFIDSKFKLKESTEPQFWYTKGRIRSKIGQNGNHVYKIYDCGSDVYLKNIS